MFSSGLYNSGFTVSSSVFSFITGESRPQIPFPARSFLRIDCNRGTRAHRISPCHTFLSVRCERACVVDPWKAPTARGKAYITVQGNTSTLSGTVTAYWGAGV